ncbi:MAG: hypothetical protein HEP71_17805 [Roseivirga sp.]|nr:hypothetical protein [Roseivirga sp.]
MKRLNTLFLVLLLVIFSACESDDVSPKDCIEVKIVEYYCTGDAVLQIVTPSAQSFGETWTSGRGTTYENVFRTSLTCHFDYEAYGAGEIFSIRLNNGQGNNNDCFYCAMAVGGLPDTFSYIEVTDACDSIAD